MVPRPSIVVTSLSPSLPIGVTPGCFSVDQHGAGAALREPATEFGAIKLKVVAKHIKQRRIGLGRHRPRFTVDLQLNGHVLDASLQAASAASCHVYS